MPERGLEAFPVAVGGVKKLLGRSDVTAAPIRGAGMNSPICCGVRALMGKDGSIHPAASGSGATIETDGGGIDPTTRDGATAPRAEDGATVVGTGDAGTAPFMSDGPPTA